MTLLMNVRIGALLLTMVLLGCGGAPNETASQEEQRSQPSPKQPPSQVTGPSQIGGFVFEDRNRNGTFDVNDTPMAQQSVILTNRSATQQIRSTTSGTDGGFRFDNLETGEYRVTLQIPEGFERTNDDSLVLTVSATGTAPDVQFGVARR